MDTAILLALMVMLLVFWLLFRQVVQGCCFLCTDLFKAKYGII